MSNAKCPRTVSEGNLKPDQKYIFKQLKNLFRCDGKKQPPYSGVFAVVGERGSSKSTILELLDQDIQSHFRTTGLIDAPNVSLDQGLMAAAVEALWQSYKTALEKKCNYDEKGAHTECTNTTKPHGDLKAKYQNCFKLALSSENSLRELARDMAMSPEQYNNMVHDWSRKLREFAPDFKEFVKDLSNAFPRKTNDPIPRLVVFLDDLDLADPEVIRNWARFYMKDLNDSPVFWVLSYDRPRLVAALSDQSLRNIGQRDLDTGEALLAKIVPFHQQLELNPWTEHDKMTFKPFPDRRKCCSTQDSGKLAKKERLPPLGKLVMKAKCEEFIPLLPNFPRGLESIYSWLITNQKEIATNNSEEEGAANGNLSATSILKKFANANGVTGLSEYLENLQAERIALTFTWPPDLQISDYSWSAIIHAVNTNSVLRGLPVPEQLNTLIENKRPIGHFETLSDIALKSGSITPYQMLHELPFTKDRFVKCNASLRFSEKNIRKSFSECRKQMTLALMWGTWDENREHNQWALHLGPGHLIDFLCDYRGLEPVEMFKQLYLNEKAQAECLRKTQADVPAEIGKRPAREPLLPRNMRGLLLLVDSFSKAPWRELAAIRNFWGPITVTQCAASFLLSALAFSIWLDETIVGAIKKKSTSKDTSKIPLLFFPVESFSVIRQLGEREINKGYIRLVAGLTDLINNEPAYIGESPARVPGRVKSREKSKGHPFQALEMMARNELRRMLQALLKLSAVTQLHLPESEQ